MIRHWESLVTNLFSNEQINQLNSKKIQSVSVNTAYHQSDEISSRGKQGSRSKICFVPFIPSSRTLKRTHLWILLP